MSRDLLVEATAFYDGLLEGEILERTHETILRVAAERRLFYHTRPLYRTLRPRFITPEVGQQIARASLAVSSALETVYRRACEDAAFRRELHVQEWEELTMPIDAASRVPSVVGRLDGIVGPDGVVRFLEYNPAPGGPFVMQDAGDAFAATPALEAFSRRYEVSLPQPATAYADAFRSNHARVGRGGEPRVAFFGPASPGDVEEEGVMREFLLAQGIAVDVVSPEDAWSHKNGRLYRRVLPVDVITYIGHAGFLSFLMECGPDHPVYQALSDGSAYFMTGLFRFLVLRSKVLFAALSALTGSSLFSPAENEALRRHVPWSRVVREGKTRYGDKEIDLLPFVAENRPRFALKPAYQLGGAGVLLGWATDDETWGATLKRALEGTWVVQERVVTQTEPYPVYDGGKVRFEEFYSDINPFLWAGGRQEGYFVRVSSNPVVNFGTGGGLTPLVVIHGRR